MLKIEGGIDEGARWIVELREQIRQHQEGFRRKAKGVNFQPRYEKDIQWHGSIEWREVDQKGRRAMEKKVQESDEKGKRKRGEGGWMSLRKTCAYELR